MMTCPMTLQGRRSAQAFFITRCCLGLMAGLTLLLLAPGAARAEPDKARWSDEQKRREALRMYRQYRKDFPKVPEMKAKEAVALLKKKTAVLVDARAPREMKVSMIPGAISKARYERRRSTYKDKQVIVYCTIGYRSGELARELRKQGEKAYNLVGGVLLWTHAGQPLIKPSPKGAKGTTQLHVYGSTWDLAPAKIKTVYP